MPAQAGIHEQAGRTMLSDQWTPVPAFAGASLMPQCGRRGDIVF